MQPTLLAIAKADLKTAKHLVGSSDKFQKHQAAYFTQQAVEKTIKYVISQKVGGSHKILSCYSNTERFYF